jgi:IPT/TIG domain
VSLREFTSRIDVVRRSFMLTSSFIAALTVAWSATPVFADASASHGARTATSQTSHGHSQPATLSAATVAAGTAPSALQSQVGLSEQQAIVAAGSGNALVTTPADPSIALGPNDVVEAVNSALQITTRTGAGPIRMNISAMIKNTSGWSVRYPRVVFDPTSGRFILTVLQFNPLLSGCGSQVAVMVSQANPIFPWISRGTINIDPELGGGMELSNVSLGLTANLVVESSDYVNCSNGLAVASQTTIIQRSDLVTGTLGVNSYNFLANGPNGLQPAMALSAQSVAYEVANNANCSAAAGGSIAVVAITGTPEGRNIAEGCTAETATATTRPAPAAQSGTTATLATGDDRFLGAVWQGNALWVAGNTGCTPSGDTQVRSCLNVDSIPATSAGSVGAPVHFAESVNGAYVYDPAIALDVSGDAILTFDESSSTTPESMMVAGITGGLWSSPITLHTSSNFYQPGGCSQCTWGDYSAAVQDPVHPTDVWVLSEETDGNTGTGCASANTCWDTFIGRYTFTGPAISSLSPAAGPASGGELVTVTGSDFAQDSALNFNGATVAITPGSLAPDSFTFTTPPGPSGLVQAQVHDSLGTSTTGIGSGYIYVGLANYVPLNPFRILDTRPSNCVQCSADPTFGPGVTRKVQLTGVTGLSIGADPIPTDATAVVLNVTEVAGTAGSLLTVYPFGTGMPRASNLNFAPGKVIANLVTVTLGQGGAVNIYNALGTVNVLADVEGYFEPKASSVVAGEFHPIAPVRVCDTRSGSLTPPCKQHGAIGAGGALLVNVTGTGAGAIPGDGTAAAAVVNLTGVAGTAATYLSLSPTNSNGQCPYSGSTAPKFSTINLSAGLVAANRVMAALGPSTPGGHANSLCVYNAAGAINVIIDAGGWFGSTSAAGGSQYQGIQPTRICDTRSGGPGCAGSALGAKGVRLIVAAGQGGIPSGTTAVAVIANLTAIAPTAATYLTMYPSNISLPLASDINLSAGEVLPNLTVVQLDPVSGADQGDVSLFNAAGSVNAVVDIEGWFQ